MLSSTLPVLKGDSASVYWTTAKNWYHIHIWYRQYVCLCMIQVVGKYTETVLCTQEVKMLFHTMLFSSNIHHWNTGHVPGRCHSNLPTLCQSAIHLGTKYWFYERTFKVRGLAEAASVINGVVIPSFHNAWWDIIIHTISQKLNVSLSFLQLPLHNPLKSGVKSRMKM